MRRRYVKVEKVEETRAEAAAKAAAAEKLLAAQEKAEAEGEGAPMETDETETAAASAPGEDPAAVGMDVDGAAAGGDAAAATDEKEPAELVKELTAFEDPELPENKTGWYELVAILTHKGQNADGGKDRHALPPFPVISSHCTDMSLRRRALCCLGAAQGRHLGVL